VLDWLTTRHGFRLHEEDGAGIDHVYKAAFYAEGPNLGYSLLGARGGIGGPNYADLMVMRDDQGRQRSFLATEANFGALKAIELKNLLVPVVGDFSGPKALRGIGEFLRKNGATVSAFYLSNVEQYLVPQTMWNRFCANVASLPLDASSTFIRSVRGDAGGTRPGVSPGPNLFRSSLGAMQVETRSCGG